jgi:Fe2+ or Zn2+ uptake regulation protein
MIPKKVVPPFVHAAETLRARGKRLTEPRRLILDVVRATDTHPSASFVYGRVRRKLPHVSLATVYRNLQMLAAEGFLLARPHPSGMRFDGNVEPHDHFTCLACGRIFDVPTAGARAAPRSAPTAGFEVLDHRIEFYGRCRVCRRRGRSATPQRRTYGKTQSQGK